MTTTARSVHVERVMGTVVSFDVRGEGDRAAGIATAVAWLHGVDERFSRWRPDSEASRYARGELGTDEHSTDLDHVRSACDDLVRRTGGAFDPALPGGWDPAAYVKGWSVDRAGALLREHGLEHWAIGAGGDVLVSSPPTGTAPWRIGVQHPEDPEAVATVLHARHLAVATSGRTHRGDHLIDPRTGRPARAAVSTTVCGLELGVADGLSTAAFVRGVDGPAMIAAIPGYECWTVLPDGRVVATAGFPTVVAGVPVSTSPVSDVLGAAA